MNLVCRSAVLPSHRLFSVFTKLTCAAQALAATGVAQQLRDIEQRSHSQETRNFVQGILRNMRL